MARRDYFTETNKQRDVYSDFLTNLNAHPEKRNIVLSKNEEAVKRAIRNLILTNKYERFYNPRFGGNIRKHLFETASPQLAKAIESDIRQTIKDYEPRARVEDVVVSAYPDDNAYSVRIVFSTKNLQKPTALDLTLYRVR